MMHLEVGGRKVPVAAGETVIGSAAEAAIVLEGAGVLPRHALVTGTAQGASAIRAAEPGADLTINGVRLGTDPTPILHGDKIQIGGHEILVVDPRTGGNTQLFDSGAFADLAPPPQIPRSPSAASGGRLVCLTDGREYTVGAEPLVFGRDAGSDVVVEGNEVSRRHAEIRTTDEGYVLADLSVNGTYVNGQRIGQQQPLARADVIRIGSHEFRFYADSAPVRPSRGPRPTPTERNPVQPPTGAGHQLSDTLHGVPVSELAGAATPPAPGPAPLASLLVRSGAFRGKRLPVNAPVVNIGRADYNDVVIAEPSVSTTHAKLQRREDIWVVSDLGSTNGTYVEGEPVTGETALVAGTTLRFGEVAVLFEPLEDHPAVRPAPTQAMERVSPEEAEARERAAAPRPQRRPIRAATPRPAGPPAWLIALLVLIALAAAYVLLTLS